MCRLHVAGWYKESMLILMFSSCNSSQEVSIYVLENLQLANLKTIDKILQFPHQVMIYIQLHLWPVIFADGT